MQASRIAARAVLVCGAATAGLALWSAADDTAAHAADRIPGPLPSTVEVTGALADNPGRAIDQLAGRATKVTKAAGAARPVKHAEETVEQIRATVVEAVEPVKSSRPLPVVAPELPAVPAEDRPADSPAPAAPKAVPAVVLLAGPAPSTVTPRDGTIAPSASLALPCGDQADEPTPPRPGHTAAPDGTPCVPDGRDASGLAAVKPPTKTGADQLAATTPSGPATPALRLLGELLPRSDLPTGRTTPPEPGPA